MKVSIQRFDPQADEKPYMQDYDVDLEQVNGIMLLDVLEHIKAKIDPTLNIRRSCGGGVCGSDGMLINGKNGLACQTQVADLPKTITLYPLPSMPIIRDLIVDMKEFYTGFEKVEPFLQNDKPPKEHEHIQTQEDRAKLDGLYECIMCGCCTAACPSSWWNPDKFIGPQGLLTAARFVHDSRDAKRSERLNAIGDPYSMYRCHGIFSCTTVCPKGLNPSGAIAGLRQAQQSDDAS